MAPFVAFYLFADGIECGSEGLHEFVGFFFGTQEHPVFAGDSQLDAVVLVLLADIDSHGPDGGEVAAEDGEFCFDSAAGLGAEVTMLGANNEFHNASQLNQCTPGWGTRRPGGPPKPFGCRNTSTVTRPVQEGIDICWVRRS